MPAEGALGLRYEDLRAARARVVIRAGEDAARDVDGLGLRRDVESREVVVPGGRTVATSTKANTAVTTAANRQPAPSSIRPHAAAGAMRREPPEPAVRRRLHSDPLAQHVPILLLQQLANERQ